MIVKQIVDEGLGNSSYIIASEDSGLAAVIDPQRDVDRYLQLAEGLGLRVTHALDTHLHADFVSGAHELAAQAGARVGASAAAELGYDHLPLNEGDTLSLGDLTLGVMTTPGHTPEHISFSVTEAGHGGPTAVFSGGALIVGGAARTDLISHDLTEPLARRLYHTLNDKLLKLADSVTVYPTHGAGSFCATPTSHDRVTTIGREKAQNYLTQARNEDEFVELALYGLPAYPVYYKELRPINQRGPKVLGGLPVLKPLAPEEVHEWVNQGGAVLDVRPYKTFNTGHIPDAYGIVANASLLIWVGWLIPFGAPLVLVAQDAAERERAVRMLIRVGYDDLRGYLEGGLAAWEAAGLPMTRVKTISVAALRDMLKSGDADAPVVLDVRHDSEWVAGHIPGATHIANGRLPYETLALPAGRPIAVHCQQGSRATAGASILARRGYQDLRLIEGGFEAWSAAGYEVDRGE